MKKVLITAGGTHENIDEVRVLTNISTGRLGAKIAEEFYFSDKDFEIHYVAPKSAVIPNPVRNGMFRIKENYYHHEVTDVQSVYDIMKELVPKMDIVIHCMAVSDFGFKPTSVKLKSNDPVAFIESLKERVYQTPKILKEIKGWNRNCFLVSFKFEVGLTTEELIRVASKAKEENGCDLVIANDKMQMKQEKRHIAYAISDYTEKLTDKDEIAKYIFNKVK